MNSLIVNLASGNWNTQLLYVICRLNIPDILSDASMDIDSLSDMTGTHRESLYRILRALSSMGIFRLDESMVSHTDISRLLVSTHPSCLSSICIMRGSEYQYKSWSNLMYSVKTGKSALFESLGISMFEYLSLHDDERLIFQRAMSCITQSVAKEIVQDHLSLFDNINKIVDIGGGEGVLVQTILSELPNVNGIVLDMGSVIRDKQVDRIEFVDGNFFNELSIRGDIYLLKYILHDWNDDKCIQILNNISSIMNRDNKLYIIESLILEDNESSYHKMLDIQMMVCLDDGAKERTQKEYEYLLSESNLYLERVIQLHTLDLSILIVGKCL